jgi:hypothetical protein
MKSNCEDGEMSKAFDAQELMEGPEYPTDRLPNAEEVYDREVVPLLEQAHRAAARAGIPIASFSAYSDEGVGAVVTCKNPDSMTAPFLVSVLIVTGSHPNCAEMLGAAVTASRDAALAGVYADMLAKGWGMDVAGLSLAQKMAALEGVLKQAEGLGHHHEEVM